MGQDEIEILVGALFKDNDQVLESEEFLDAEEIISHWIEQLIYDELKPEWIEVLDRILEGQAEKEIAEDDGLLEKRYKEIQPANRAVLVEKHHNLIRKYLERTRDRLIEVLSSRKALNALQKELTRNSFDDAFIKIVITQIKQKARHFPTWVDFKHVHAPPVLHRKVREDYLDGSEDAVRFVWLGKTAWQLNTPVCEGDDVEIVVYSARMGGPRFYKKGRSAEIDVVPLYTRGKVPEDGKLLQAIDHKRRLVGTTIA